MISGNMNNLRTIEAQIVQKRENNEALSIFTGSYKKMRVFVLFGAFCSSEFATL